MHESEYLHDQAALRVSFGPNALLTLARDLDRAGLSRAVVICGRSLASDGGGLNLLNEALGARLVAVHPGARAHSPVPDVIDASRVLRDMGADVVIAVGGGSAIVTARAASIVLAEGEDVARLATTIGPDGRMISPKLTQPKLPQYVVPTTPTTAGVKAGSAILDPNTAQRLALFDPKTRSRAVHIDARLLADVPRAVFISAGLNTLCMAVEGLMATKGDPFADAQLSHALRLSYAALSGLDGTDDDGARAGLMSAAVLCGRGTDSTNGGLTTALGHAIGARHHVENGIVNAIVMGDVLAFNSDAAARDLGKIGQALDLTPSAQPAAAAASISVHLRELFDRLGVPVRLSTVGVTADALPKLAELATQDWFLRGNPRPVRDARDMQDFMERLL